MRFERMRHIPGTSLLIASPNGLLAMVVLLVTYHGNPSTRWLTRAPIAIGIGCYRRLPPLKLPFRICMVGRFGSFCIRMFMYQQL